jgi:hypothetical protein
MLLLPSGLHSVSPILFNIIMNDICNKIREKMKVIELKTFIYAEDIKTWGDKMKEPETRLAH